MIPTREELTQIRGVSPKPAQAPTRAEQESKLRAQSRAVLAEKYPSPEAKLRQQSRAYLAQKYPQVYGAPSPAPSPAPAPTPRPTRARQPAQPTRLMAPSVPTVKSSVVGARPRPSVKHRGVSLTYVEKLEEQRKKRLAKYKPTEPEAKPATPARPQPVIPSTLKFAGYEVKTSHVVVGASLALVVIALLVFT